jgi:transcription elongation factor GreA
MAEERFVLSQAGYDALMQELNALQAEYDERREEFFDANSDVDPAPEEAAYFDTRVRKEFLEERIGHLKLVLERAEIVTEDADPHGVDAGERVVVWDFSEDRERVFNLVSSTEAVYAHHEIPGHEVSIDSPVGQALVGRCVGEVVEVQVPDGTAKYVIRRIEPIA